MESHQREDISNRFISRDFQRNTAEATLHQMLGDEETPKRSAFCCECGKKCEIAYEHPTQPHSNSLYCKECIEPFCFKCAGCYKSIIGQFATDGSSSDKKWHISCFKEEFRCKACKKPIFDCRMNALGADWHPECFKCTKCYTKLESQFFDQNGYPYCEQCTQESMTKIPKKITSTPPSTPNPNREALERERKDMEKVFQNIQMGKETCPLCHEVLCLGDGVEFNGGLYHEACFSCSLCNKNIPPGSSFGTKNGNPVCSLCLTGGKKFCAQCGQPLSGRFTAIGDSVYHHGCFTCSLCKGPLTKGYALISNQPFCGPCAQKKHIENRGNEVKTREEIRVATQGRKEGFVIDPMTGEKKTVTKKYVTQN